MSRIWLIFLEKNKMEFSFESILTWAYGVIGVVNFCAYIPTAIDLWNKKMSATMLSWIIWSFGAIVALSYAILINKDPVFIFVTASNSFMIFLVFALVIRLKYFVDPTKIQK